MNQAEVVKAHWNDIRGEVQKTWGKLSFDDIERTNGDVSAISSLVQQKHGVDAYQFDQKFAEIVKSMDGEHDVSSRLDS